MKILTVSAIAIALSISLPMAAKADSVKEIVEGLQKEKAAKLEIYLKENPKAEDRLEGISHLITAYTNIGQDDNIEPLLKEKYDLLVTDVAIKDLSLDEILITSRPLILSLIASGKKDEASSFLKKEIDLLSQHSLADKIIPFLTQYSDMLHAPGGGEVLDISFTDIDGHKVDLASMKGKVVIVDFWATWCPPCIEEFPNLQNIYKDFHDQGLEVISISLDVDTRGAEQLIRMNKIPWYQQIAGKDIDENEFTQKYNISFLPAIFVIGKDGKIAANFLSGLQLRKAVERELKK